MSRVLAFSLAVASGAAGCGPIAYINQVTRAADDAVEEARAVQADRFAPYHWTLATNYLHEARVVAAHADFQGATRFGRLATEAAVAAREEAIAAAKDPSKRPLDDAPAAAPAKVAPAKDAAPAKVAPAKDDAPVAPAKDDAP